MKILQRRRVRWLGQRALLLWGGLASYQTHPRHATGHAARTQIRCKKRFLSVSVASKNGSRLCRIRKKSSDSERIKPLQTLNKITFISQNTAQTLRNTFTQPLILLVFLTLKKCVTRFQHITHTRFNRFRNYLMESGLKENLYARGYGGYRDGHFFTFVGAWPMARSRIRSQDNFGRDRENLKLNARSNFFAVLLTACFVNPVWAAISA